MERKALIAAGSGRTSEACKMLEKSLKIAEEYYSKPNRIEVLRIKEAIGDMYFRGDHYDEAIEIYSNIITCSCSKHTKFFEVVGYKKKEAVIEKSLRNRPKS